MKVACGVRRGKGTSRPRSSVRRVCRGGGLATTFRRRNEPAAVVVPWQTEAKTAKGDPMERMQAKRDSMQRKWRGQVPVLGVGLVMLGLVLWWVSGFGWRHSALFMVGVLMGLTLYATAFGFTTGYRRAVLLGDVDSVEAQLVMLAVAMVLFAPILSGTASAGLAVTGAYAPVGPQVAIGAFLFGVGMQLGGGCGSGAEAESSGAFSGGGGDRGPVARLRVAHRVRLQHRCVLLGRSVDEPARLGVDRGGGARDVARRQAPAVVRTGQRGHVVSHLSRIREPRTFESIPDIASRDTPGV